MLNSPVCPVLHYSKIDCKLGTGDLILPVYVDYNAVVHFYTMGGGMLDNVGGTSGEERRCVIYDN